jgi:hypothetical protein
LIAALPSRLLPDQRLFFGRCCSKYRFAGSEFRLTDVEGHVVKDVLA